MHKSNSSKPYIAIAAPSEGGVPLTVLAPNLLVIIANYAKAKGRLFISTEEQQSAILNYCHMAAKNN